MSRVQNRLNAPARFKLNAIRWPSGVKTGSELLAFVGSAGLGVVGVATAITIQRARSGGPKAPVDQAKLETVTLTIRGMI